MKKLTFYFIFLMMHSQIPSLMAQEKGVEEIEWKLAGSIPAAIGQAQSIGLAGAMTGVAKHVVILVGGTNFPDRMPWLGGKKQYYDDVFVFCENKKSGKMNAVETSFKLPFKLAYGAVGSYNGNVIVAGGENEGGKSDKVFAIKWNELTKSIVVEFLPELPSSITNAALNIVDHKLYLAGGETKEGATDQFLVLDLKHQELGWKKLPNLLQRVSHTVLLNLKERNTRKLFLIGGRKANPGDTSSIYKNVYAFDIEKNSWIEQASLPYAVSAASGVAVKDQLYLFSGDTGETFHKVERLIGQIAVENNPEEKANLEKEKIDVQSTHPGFSKKVLRFNPINNSWSAMENLLPYGTVTTNAVLFHDKIIIAGGEIRAGVRTPEIIVGEFEKK